MNHFQCNIRWWEQPESTIHASVHFMDKTRYICFTARVISLNHICITECVLFFSLNKLYSNAQTVCNYNTQHFCVSWIYTSFELNLIYPYFTFDLDSSFTFRPSSWVSSSKLFLLWEWHNIVVVITSRLTMYFA